MSGRAIGVMGLVGLVAGCVAPAGTGAGGTGPDSVGGKGDDFRRTSNRLALRGAIERTVSLGSADSCGIGPTQLVMDWTGPDGPSSPDEFQRLQITAVLPNFRWAPPTSGDRLVMEGDSGGRLVLNQSWSSSRGQCELEVIGYYNEVDRAGVALRFGDCVLAGGLGGPVSVSGEASCEGEGFDPSGWYGAEPPDDRDVDPGAGRGTDPGADRGTDPGTDPGAVHDPACEADYLPWLADLSGALPRAGRSLASSHVASVRELVDEIPCVPSASPAAYEAWLAVMSRLVEISYPERYSSPVISSEEETVTELLLSVAPTREAGARFGEWLDLFASRFEQTYPLRYSSPSLTATEEQLLDYLTRAKPIGDGSAFYAEWLDLFDARLEQAFPRRYSTPSLKREEREALGYVLDARPSGAMGADYEVWLDLFSARLDQVAPTRHSTVTATEQGVLDLLLQAKPCLFGPVDIDTAQATYDGWAPRTHWESFVPGAAPEGC